MDGTGNEGAAEPGEERDREPTEGRGQPAVAGGNCEGNGKDNGGGGQRLSGEERQPIGAADEANAAGYAGEDPAGEAEFGADENEAEGGQQKRAVGVE